MRMKARTTNTLILTASGEFNTVAAMIAPCSVNAWGRLLENFSLVRWSHFATTSRFSPAVSLNMKSSGKRPALRFTCSLSRLVATP